MICRETNPNYLEENSTAKKTKDRIPKRPRTPFSYYYSSEIRRMSIPNADRGTFRETCKNKWKELSDKAKLPWIHMTEVELGKYTVGIKFYVGLTSVRWIENSIFLKAAKNLKNFQWKMIVFRT